MTRRLRIILLALLVLCVAGEIGARVWDAVQGPTGSLYDSIVPAGDRFKLRPSTSALVPERYGNITYRFNRLGYRDVDHDPRARRRRLVWLGDSVSFGLGVEQDSTFVALLQKRLAAGTEPPLEVANLSVFAYHTGNELDALREDGLPLRPELVVVQFYMNDFATPGTGVAGAPSPAPASARLPGPAHGREEPLPLQIGARAPAQPDLRPPRLCAGARSAAAFPETLNDAQPRSDQEFLRAHPDDRSIAAFQALLVIRDVAARSGARLFVFISPDEVQLFTPRYDLINERLARFCAAQGLDCWDPLPQLRAAADRDRLFYDGVHYSPRGHARLADLLYAAMDQRGLFDPGDPGVRF